MRKQLLAIWLALSLAVGLLAGLVWMLGTTPSVMLGLMQKHAPSESTYLPAEEYPAMADMITGYLRGQVADFQHIFRIDGTAYLAFRTHEQQHMADCRMLFLLARQVGIIALLVSAILTGLLWMMRRQAGSIWKGFAGGLFGVMGLAVVVAVWGVMDFQNAFVLFHQLSFTNDLWLLNPQTDLLIRLMPTSFFMDYAALLGALWLAGMLLMLLAGWIHHRQHKEGKKA